MYNIDSSGSKIKRFPTFKFGLTTIVKTFLIKHIAVTKIQDPSLSVQTWSVLNRVGLSCSWH